MSKINKHLIDYSIVIVGNGFSPNSYSGETFIEKGIVLESWNWKVSNSVSNNLFSHVVYDGGKTIVKVEKNNISITENYFDPTSQNISKSKTKDFAKRFLQRHKHLTYTALGINFTTLVEIEDNKGYLLKEFIDKEKKKSLKHPIDSVALSTFYKLNDGGRLGIKLEEGELERQNQQEKVILKGLVSNANFHRDFSQDLEIAIIISLLNHVKDDLSLLNEILDETI